MNNAQKTPCRARRAALVGTLTTLLGCFGPLPPREEGSPTGALRGPLVFRAGPGAPAGRCSPAETELIRRAWEVARRIVTSPDGRFQACLERATFSPADGAWAELILARLREDSPTYVDCTTMSSEGEAPVASATGVIRLSHDVLRGEARDDPNAVARVMLHELAHNRGYIHHGRPRELEYEASVNRHAERCVSALTGAPSEASEPADEAVVRSQPFGAVGAHDAEPFQLDCPPRVWVTGQRVQHDPASGRVAAVAVRCSSGWGGAVTEPFFPAVMTAEAEDCPRGSVVVGVQAYATGERVVGLQMLCGSRADLSLAARRTVPLPLHGGAGAVSVRRVCPPGEAVVSVSGTLGQGLRQLGIECHDARRPFAGPRVVQRRLGVGGPDVGRVRLFRRCGDQGVMIGLFGYQSVEGAIVRMGGVCQDVDFDGQGRPHVRVSADEHLLPAAGGEAREGAPAFGHLRDAGGHRCASGSGMVGLRLAFALDGQRVSGVQALCASPDEWSSERPPEPQEVDLAGSFSERGQRTDAARCAFGQFLVGVGVHVSTADRRGSVVAVTPICRDFHATSE